MCGGSRGLVGEQGIGEVGARGGSGASRFDGSVDFFNGEGHRLVVKRTSIHVRAEKH